MIRPFCRTDLDSIAEIWLNTNISAHNFIPESYWRDNFLPVREMLGKAEIYVYAEDDGIRGFIGLDGNYIAGIFVRKGGQSRGIGRKLIAFVKEKKPELSLHVYEKNQRAVKFYEREGFAIRSRSVDENTGEQELLMTWKHQHLKRMTNQEILRIAMEQSAVDLNCRAEDFLKTENVIVHSAENPGARKYLELPFTCDLVSYGSNIVASVEPQYEEIVKGYIGRYLPEHCFETPNLYVLNETFAEYGMKVCFMAEYFLPDVDQEVKNECEYALALMGPEDFKSLYIPCWSNALCEARKELDVLGIGAYREGKLIGLAACSADCDSMWQIGVDVLPEYRRQGIASALTGALSREILRRGKVPFYCCAWSNIKSARNAIKSGFRPAWAELTVKPAEFVEKMNR